MTASPLRAGVAVVVGLVFCGAAYLRAQEPGKAKDDGLDALLEKLAGSDQSKAPQAGKATGAKTPARDVKDRATRADDQPKVSGGVKPAQGKSGQASGDKSGKPPTSKSGAVAPKDQAIDDLLEKLGETKD